MKHKILTKLASSFTAVVMLVSMTTAIPANAGYNGTGSGGGSGTAGVGINPDNCGFRIYVYDYDAKEIATGASGNLLVQDVLSNKVEANLAINSSMIDTSYTYWTRLSSPSQKTEEIPYMWESDLSNLTVSDASGASVTIGSYINFGGNLNNYVMTLDNPSGFDYSAHGEKFATYMKEEVPGTSIPRISFLCAALWGDDYTNQSSCKVIVEPLLATELFSTSDPGSGTGKFMYATANGFHKYLSVNGPADGGWVGGPMAALETGFHLEEDDEECGISAGDMGFYFADKYGNPNSDWSTIGCDANGAGGKGYGLHIYTLEEIGGGKPVHTYQFRDEHGNAKDPNKPAGPEVGTDEKKNKGKKEIVKIYVDGFVLNQDEIVDNTKSWGDENDTGLQETAFSYIQQTAYFHQTDESNKIVIDDEYWDTQSTSTSDPASKYFTFRNGTTVQSVDNFDEKGYKVIAWYTDNKKESERTTKTNMLDFLTLDFDASSRAKDLVVDNDEKYPYVAIGKGAGYTNTDIPNDIDTNHPSANGNIKWVFGATNSTGDMVSNNGGKITQYFRLNRHTKLTKTLHDDGTTNEGGAESRKYYGSMFTVCNESLIKTLTDMQYTDESDNKIKAIDKLTTHSTDAKQYYYAERADLAKQTKSNIDTYYANRTEAGAVTKAARLGFKVKSASGTTTENCLKSGTATKISQLKSGKVSEFDDDKLNSAISKDFITLGNDEETLYVLYFRSHNVLRTTEKDKLSHLTAKDDVELIGNDKKGVFNVVKVYGIMDTTNDSFNVTSEDTKYELDTIPCIQAVSEPGYTLAGIKIIDGRPQDGGKGDLTFMDSATGTIKSATEYNAEEWCNGATYNRYYGYKDSFKSDFVAAGNGSKFGSNCLDDILNTTFLAIDDDTTETQLQNSNNVYFGPAYTTDHSPVGTMFLLYLKTTENAEQQHLADNLLMTESHLTQQQTLKNNEMTKKVKNASGAFDETKILLKDYPFNFIATAIKEAHNKTKAEWNALGTPETWIDGNIALTLNTDSISGNGKEVNGSFGSLTYNNDGIVPGMQCSIRLGGGDVSNPYNKPVDISAYQSRLGYLYSIDENTPIKNGSEITTLTGRQTKLTLRDLDYIFVTFRTNDAAVAAGTTGAEVDKVRYPGWKLMPSLYGNTSVKPIIEQASNLGNINNGMATVAGSAFGSTLNRLAIGYVDPASAKELDSATTTTGERANVIYDSDTFREWQGAGTDSNIRASADNTGDNHNWVVNMSLKGYTEESTFKNPGTHNYYIPLTSLTGAKTASDGSQICIDTVRKVKVNGHTTSLPDGTYGKVSFLNDSALSDLSIGVYMEVWGGKADGGQDAPSTESDTVNVNGMAGFRKALDSSITFNPYIKMQTESEMMASDNDSSSGNLSTSTYVSSQYNRTLTPYTFVGVKYEAASEDGAKTVKKLGDADVSARGFFVITSDQWSTHARAAKIDGASLPGGAIMNLTIPETNRQKIEIAAFRPILTGTGKAQVVNTGSSSLASDATTAVDAFTAFATNVKDTIETLNLEMWVTGSGANSNDNQADADGIYSGSGSKADNDIASGPVWKLSHAEAVSRGGTLGGSPLSDESKYYFDEDLDPNNDESYGASGVTDANASDGDLDVLFTDEDGAVKDELLDALTTRYYTFFVTAEGNICVKISDDLNDSSIIRETDQVEGTMADKAGNLIYEKIDPATGAPAGDGKVIIDPIVRCKDQSSNTYIVKVLSRAQVVGLNNYDDVSVDPQSIQSKTATPNDVLNLIGGMSGNGTVAKRVNAIKTIEQGTQIVYRLYQSLELGSGCDDTAPWAALTGDTYQDKLLRDRTVGRWYYEAFDGITYVYNKVDLQAGFIAPYARTSILDPRLTPKSNDKADLFSLFRLAQFKIKANSGSTVIGTYEGKDVSVTGLDKLFVSQMFYIPNVNVQDLK